MSATVVVPTHLGGTRLERLLQSLAGQTQLARTIVVDNASPCDVAKLVAGHEFAEHLRLAENVGFARAVNLAAARTSDDALVLVNDDCVCGPHFVEELAAALDPAAGVVMAAGVLVEAHDPWTIDTAGMELDDTLLVFDYLNGEPVAALGPETPAPIGPCAAAAAFDRAAFCEVGGFDERLFAYWEDVDLVLRLLGAGGRCTLASGARGTHEHSATLGSGSPKKNYLTGFGCGYVLRKWSVHHSPHRAMRALLQAGILCAGQALFDRTLSGTRGRLDGFAAAADVPRLPYPAAHLRNQPATARSGLVRRLRRRGRLHQRAKAEPRLIAGTKAGVVDIVIVSYRCRDHLRRCLSSVTRHAPAGACVWVVDNGSRDGTVEMVSDTFPSVSLIESGENAGFSRATNRGIVAGRAPYVLVLNPDTELHENTLDTLLELMDEHSEIGIAGPRLERPDGTFDHASRRSFPTVIGALGHFSGIGRRLERGPLAQYRAPEIERGAVDAVNGAFMLIRRAALEQVGLFDEGYWMYMEDLDLCFRFKQAGWITWYEPSSVALHVKGGSAGTRSPRLVLAFHGGMWRFYRIHVGSQRSTPVNLAVATALAFKLVGALTRSGVATAWKVSTGERSR